MAKAERVSRILTLLKTYRLGVTTAKFLEHLGVARATFFRDIAVLRDQMKQPIVFDKSVDPGVWRLDQTQDTHVVRDELPGVWLSVGEAYALLTLFRVLQGIDPGFLEEYIAPLSGLLKRLLDRHLTTTHQFGRKVSIRLGPFARANPQVMMRVSEALVRDQRLKLIFKLQNGARAEKVVSPQRVVLSARGWKLDVLDHEEGELRTIPLPKIIEAALLPIEAEIAATELPSRQASR